MDELLDLIRIFTGDNEFEIKRVIDEAEIEELTKSLRILIRYKTDFAEGIYEALKTMVLMAVDGDHAVEEEKEPPKKKKIKKKRLRWPSLVYDKKEEIEKVDEDAESLVQDVMKQMIWLTNIVIKQDEIIDLLKRDYIELSKTKTRVVCKKSLDGQDDFEEDDEPEKWPSLTS